MNVIKQFIKFSIVGVIATIIDVGVLTLLVEVFGAPVLISSTISFCVSVIFNYLLSMTFVFKSKNQGKVKEFIIFLMLSICGLGLNQLIMWFGENHTSIHYLIVKFFAICFVLVYNFVSRKIFLESKEK